MARQPERTARSDDVITQALILAGGQGTRLAPLSEYLPKCLATVYNRPLIDYQLRLLQSAGVTAIWVAVSAQHSAVMRESIRLLERPVDVELAVEAEPLGVSALFEACGQLPAGPFWLLLGDIYLEAEQLKPIDLPEGKDAVLLTRGFADPVQLATATANIVVEGERVIAVRDKPATTAVKGNLGWTGLAVIGPDFLYRRSAILKWLDKKPVAHFGDLFEAALWLGASIAAAPAPVGAWININTPEQLIEAAQCEARKRAQDQKPIP
jgi:NDP-sugar pyrophosphorylase family protein